MLSPSAWAILRLLGWMFLPDMMARTAVKAYHKVRLRTIPIFSPTSVFSPPPPPGSPAFIVQQRSAFALVVLGYLIWTTIQAYITATPSLYHLLNVPFDADEATMKTAFRNFAKINHPDKVGPGGEPLFIAIRDAFDALKHPVKRFAYDRFGPDALIWQGVDTARDYVMRGLMASSGFYIGTSFFLLLHGIFGAGGVGAYWKYIIFIAMAALELQLIQATHTQTFLSTLFPNRLPFQLILFLHQLFISTSIAITRVGPVLFPGLATSKAGSGNLEWIAPITERLVVLAQMAEKELSRMLAVELRAMHGVRTEEPADAQVNTAVSKHRFPTQKSTFNIAHQPQEWDPEIVGRLRREMENMIVDKNLRNHPMLGTIWEGVVKNKYEELRLQQSQSQSEQPQPPSPILIRARSRAKSEPPQSPLPSLPSPPTSVSTLPPQTEDAYTCDFRGQSREGSPVPILESSPEPVPIKRSPSTTPGYVRARSLDLIAQESRL